MGYLFDMERYQEHHIVHNYYDDLKSFLLIHVIQEKTEKRVCW